MAAITTQLFSYTLGDGDALTVIAASAAADIGGLGSGYQVLSVAGFIGGQAIVGLTDNTLSGVFTSDTAGFGGSVNGIDGDGIEFRTATANYEFYSSDGQFILYDITANTKLEVSVVVTNAPCYCSGTLIRTASGERPVEHLAIGDLVVTATGQQRPIKWLGHRAYSGRFLAANPARQPIRFRAGSLGDALPRRDLLVSPDHAMFIDGVLVPARELMNGITVVQERHLQQVDYHHVELDTHDVLLAEGAPSESFVDDDSRAVFHNAPEFATLYPDHVAVVRFCAPRVDSGPVLDAIRRRLAEIAGTEQLAA